MSYSTQEQTDNFKWLDSSCSTPVDGYLCYYTYQGMCPALWNEGAGDALYTTPFNLLSTMLTHVPLGSMASVPCVSSAQEESVLCMLRKDNSVGWSQEPPLCSALAVVQNWCDHDNGGCEHFCRPSGSHFYCECDDGYQLGEDAQSCELFNVCQGAPCEFECLPLSDSFRCACPDGYMLAPDERGCLDVDECLQSPCEQLCENAVGSFQCQCHKGYYPDDMGGCEDIDECMSEPCEHACENTQGSHVCHCHLGYSLVPEDPSRCQDTDECQIAGTCDQMCVNYEGGFDCYCEEGFELMPDHYSCQKRSEVDHGAAVTPLFPWASHPPGLAWDLFPIDPEIIPLTQEKENGNTDNVLEWATRSQLLQDVFPTLFHPAPFTSSPNSPPTNSFTPPWYEKEEEEEATTPLPLPSTSTVSGGAWNWWVEFSASSGSPSNLPVDPEGSLTEDNMSTKSSKEGNATVPTVPPTTRHTLHDSRGTVVDVLDTAEEDRGQKKSHSWLLVGLLVPICILVVVMVALGAIYCMRCSVQPQDKRATDCYHWMSGAHDPQGAQGPSAGVKAHV
uniref:Complement component C1q receptor-like n=1 Tax=Gouania willdenowi TaxID=441366 RepID=A0A8C5HW19_GOUWI